MSYKAIGLGVASILEKIDIPDFVNCWRLVLLEHVAENAKGGLTEELIRYLPVMCELLIELECIPNELPTDDD